MSDQFFTNHHVYVSFKVAIQEYQTSIFRVDANYVIMVATILIPASMFVIPLCNALLGLAIVLSVMGINMGLIDTLANLQMIQLYQESVPPFLQVIKTYSIQHIIMYNHTLLILCQLNDDDALIWNFVFFLLLGNAFLLWSWGICQSHDCWTISS